MLASFLLLFFIAIEAAGRRYLVDFLSYPFPKMQAGLRTIPSPPLSWMVLFSECKNSKRIFPLLSFILGTER